MMFKILLPVIFLGILVLFVLASLVKGIFSFLFGRPTTTANARANNQRQNNSHNTNRNNQNGQTHEKEFAPDEGEYVPYEEIKE